MKYVPIVCLPCFSRARHLPRPNGLRMHVGKQLRGFARYSGPVRRKLMLPIA